MEPRYVLLESFSCVPSSDSMNGIKRQARIRIALVDDQILVRNGIAELLGLDTGLEIVVMAANGSEAREALVDTPVDVIVMDIRMPGDSGIESLQKLRDSGDATPVLMLTTFDEPELLLQSTAAGAPGFMLKDASPEDLISAIRTLSEGGSVLEPISIQPIRARHNYSATPRIEDLSERELDILRLMAGGYSNKEIADVLHLAVGTIKNYVSEILIKLDARDRTRAVLKAITQHIL